jgi:diguanylate cyclase (GGDEF)-like protein
MSMQRAVGGNARLLMIAVITAIAVIGATLPNNVLPRMAIIGPIVYFFVIFTDAVTATILMRTLPWSLRPRPTLVLALWFAINGALLLIAVIVLPVLPNSLPVFAGPAQFGSWIAVLWHLTAALTALVYLGFRRAESGRPLTRGFWVWATGVAGLVVCCNVAVALFLADHVSLLVRGSTLAGMIANGVGPAVVVLLALAAVLAFCIRQPGATEGALALSLFCFSVEWGLLLFGGRRYSAAFYAGKLLFLPGSLFVLVTAIHTLVGSHERLNDVEDTLHRVEAEARKVAGRFRALWQIASYTGRSEGDRFSAMLEIAASAIRPERPMFGCLSRLSGAVLHIDTTCWTGFGPVLPDFSHALRPGVTFPFGRTLAKLLHEAGRSAAWDDLKPVARRTLIVEDFSWGSCIGAPIVTADEMYFLTFASPRTTLDEPYTEADLAYIDVVASSFGARFAQREQFERIQFQIDHDSLTGLENRLQFRKAVRDEIQTSHPFALAFINIDGFRHLNAREGHEIGDEVLVEVAEALLSVDGRDLVARMGADEFGLLVRDVPSLEAATSVIDRYARLFLTPFQMGDRNGVTTLDVGASIGASRYPDDGTSAEDLMRRANVALDVAKVPGNSPTIIFAEPMEALLDASQLRVIELSNAIDNGELDVLYQPTFELKTRRVVGAEALVRWNHPQRGVLLPGEFIAFAERNLLIGPLSHWVLHRVADDLTSDGTLPSGFRVYFNVAAQLLDDVPFIADVSDVLGANPGLAEHLGVEMTETAAMHNVERSMDTINLFRRWGLSVAIDDFGTGYSSLSYLKRLTVDVIKIDRSFVSGLPDDARDCTIIEMLLHIKDRFEFAALAEGVETEAQAAWLLEHGCQFAQGYLVAKPEPFSALLRRLELAQVA